MSGISLAKAFTVVKIKRAAKNVPNKNDIRISLRILNNAVSLLHLLFKLFKVKRRRSGVFSFLFSPSLFLVRDIFFTFFTFFTFFYISSVCRLFVVCLSLVCQSLCQRLGSRSNYLS